jgi:indolepyruvate ferredoxin oxidoreductase beta subunit
MFGAIAATKILPWEKEISESVFDANEFGKNSLEGFRLAFDKISNKNVIIENKGIDKESNKADKISISIDVPESLKKIIYLSMERCEEYQNMEYANLFLNRICELINKIDKKNKNSLSIIENSARRLCLWMVYEDISRVAQLKISKNRVEKIKKEVNLKNDQLLIVKDYFKPGVDEIIAIMPNRLGKWLSNNKKLFKLFPFVGKGIKINVLSISGYILMRILSSIRKIRPYSYRYIQESKEIDLWLEAMKYSLEKSTKFADQLSNLPHLLKGYGDTWIRGKEKYSKVFNTLVSPLISKNILEQDVENLKEAISIAMNTVEIDKLDRFLLTRK